VAKNRQPEVITRNPYHLQGEKFGGRLGQTLYEHFLHHRAHAPLRQAFTRRDFRDRHASVQEADDPHLPLGALSARRPPRRDRLVAASGWANGFDGSGGHGTNIEHRPDFGKEKSRFLKSS
jgi:hypothetical protein